MSTDYRRRTFSRDRNTYFLIGLLWVSSLLYQDSTAPGFEIVRSGKDLCSESSSDSK